LQKIDAILKGFSSWGKTKGLFIDTLSEEKDPVYSEGAKSDASRMKAAFEARGFDFECVKTLSNADLEILCRRLKTENFTKVGKIVVMIVAHGNKKDKIESHSGNFFLTFYSG
jgi:hypothetical protein